MWGMEGRDAARQSAGHARTPVIIARTVKGKGVPFMEGHVDFHNAMISDEQFNAAVESLQAKALASGSGS